MTAKLAEPVCFECGQNLSEQESGAYGVICPDCGSVNPTELDPIAKA